MTDLRFFRWITSETESARLQSEGARLCHGSLSTHHANHAVLMEITPEQFDQATAGER